MSAAAESALPGFYVLEQTPIILEKILLGADEHILGWKPAMDRWSISEVMAHLAEVETVFHARARKMAEEKDPAIEAYDQNVAYAAGKYSGGKGREHLRRFCHERDRSLSFLRYLPAEAVARTGQHAELGHITLGELLHEWAFHDLGHIRQVSELYRAKVFYPKMGGFQRYYTVKP